MLRPGDDGLVAAASHLFDGPARPEATARFLAEDGHHLHPDKGTEMFLYELAVDEPARGRGIGRALVERLATLARAEDCYGMWVVTDDANEGARATYEGTGALPETGRVVEVWTFSLVPGRGPQASASTSWTPARRVGGPPSRVSTANPPAASCSVSKTTMQVPVPLPSFSHSARTKPGSASTSGTTYSESTPWRCAASAPGSITTSTTAA